jgi:hypothetical protein
MTDFAMTERHADEALALALLHHVGVRFSYSPDDRPAMERMNRIARNLQTRLAA